MLAVAAIPHIVVGGDGKGLWLWLWHRLSWNNHGFGGLRKGRLLDSGFNLGDHQIDHIEQLGARKYLQLLTIEHPLQRL